MPNKKEEKGGIKKGKRKIKDKQPLNKRKKITNPKPLSGGKQIK